MPVAIVGHVIGFAWKYGVNRAVRDLVTIEAGVEGDAEGRKLIEVLVGRRPIRQSRFVPTRLWGARPPFRSE